MKTFKEKFLEWLLPFAFGIVWVIFSMWLLSLVLEKSVQNIKQDKRPECTQIDMYKIEEMSWKECKDGKQKRDLIKTENLINDTLSCKNPGKVSTPDLEKSCKL